MSVDLRPWAAVLTALLLAGCNAAAQEQPTNPAIRIDAQSVPMDPAHPQDIRKGDFTYAGGLALKSPDTTLFGGLSDLQIDADGRLTAQSDQGELLTAHIRLDAERRLSGLDQAELRPLLGLDGKPLEGKREADAEGLAIWPNGDRMVSFERDHRIWLYPAGGGPPHAAPMPPVAMPDNEGMEGLALAPTHGPDAYWVGIEGGSIWLCRLSGQCLEQKGEVSPGLGRRLSGLTEAPNGDLVILHHGWNPLTNVSSIRVWITRPRGDGGPARILGRLDVTRPLTVDNFEGVQTASLPGGGLRIFMISDDNFSPAQRTLLVAYDWTPHRR